MTAETLRRAATLMRERAESATPGPWVVPGPDDEYVGPADVVSDGEPGNRYIICEHAGVDALHIASWHPAVALAVAEAMDTAARHLERGKPMLSRDIALYRAACEFLGENDALRPERGDA